MTRLKVILVTLLCPPLMVVGYGMRSEEHTSELQSR